MDLNNIILNYAVVQDILHNNSHRHIKCLNCNATTHAIYTEDADQSHAHVRFVVDLQHIRPIILYDAYNKATANKDLSKQERVEIFTKELIGTCGINLWLHGEYESMAAQLGISLEEYPYSISFSENREVYQAIHNLFI